jgi:hypothetical protein
MKLGTVSLLLAVVLQCSGMRLFAEDKPKGIIQLDNGQIRPVEKTLINDTDYGFVPLFDGKTINGWIQRGGKAKYTVEDGMIVGTTVPKTPNSFLCTEKDYGDFILELEFKVDPAMNSGVQFRSECFDEPVTIKVGDKEIKIPAGRVHGYQYEIDMDVNRKVNGKPRLWTAGVYDEARRKWLYPGILGGDEAAFSEQGAKICKHNDWNHVRIEAVGDSIKTWLNGALAADFKDSMTPKGFIALQVHDVGDRQEPMYVYWKNIRIKELIPNEPQK